MDIPSHPASAENVDAAMGNCCCSVGERDDGRDGGGGGGIGIRGGRVLEKGWNTRCFTFLRMNGSGMMINSSESPAFFASVSIGNTSTLRKGSDKYLSQS
jgi:hypothetical protein